MLQWDLIGIVFPFMVLNILNSKTLLTSSNDNLKLNSFHSNLPMKNTKCN